MELEWFDTNEWGMEEFQIICAAVQNEWNQNRLTGRVCVGGMLAKNPSRPRINALIQGEVLFSRILKTKVQVCQHCS